MKLNTILQIDKVYNLNNSVWIASIIITQKITKLVKLQKNIYDSTAHSINDGR